MLGFVPARVSPARGRVRRCVPGVCGRESQGLFSAPKALALRAETRGIDTTSAVVPLPVGAGAVG